jgi:TPR repeat protein
MKFSSCIAACLLATMVGSAHADLQEGRTAYAAQDWRTAYREFLPLAKAGNPEAQTVIGLLYTQGHGVWRNNTQAAQWLQLAAAQGWTEAQEALGKLYHDGVGVPKDPAQALQLFQAAATQGLALAQYDLGVLYAAGDDVPQDFHEAAHWFELGARQNLAAAQYNLGLLYQNGQGVKHDDQEARRLYQAAAAQGHALAQSNLGALYEGGIGGLPRNFVVAYALYDLAAAQPSPAVALALKNRDLLASRLSPEEIRAARTLRHTMAAGQLSAAIEQYLAGTAKR